MNPMDFQHHAHEPRGHASANEHGASRRRRCVLLLSSQGQKSWKSNSVEPVWVKNFKNLGVYVQI